ncbi:MAG TPA: UdgX family uracil-DNA binding protein [Myxococcaceae bacterium]|nr:UdgX family uracil-DNA binding protein [Myxococcaceae bacterium]
MPPRTPKTTAARWVPDRGGLAELQRAARECRGCDLWRNATQTVFGEGPTHPELVLVGEQPGDKEDLAGHPFIGPAGRVLDEALEAVGIDRRRTYVTNAVKHFKWERGSGQRRIHARPNQIEIQACRPWLEAELSVLRPEVLVCLGSTAAQALLGRPFRVTLHRGEWVPSPLAPHVLATVHPSSILRAPDEAARAEAMEAFIRDLRPVARLLASGGTRSGAPGS